MPAPVIGKRKIGLYIPGGDPSVDWYLSEIAKTPLLTFEEEQNLFRQLAQSAEGERRTVVRESITNANLRLVVAIAKRYFSQNGHMNLLDLIQEGNIGLLRAIDKFDLTLGYRFSTYATWWIRQSIARAVNDKNETIRLPVHINEKIANANKHPTQDITERQRKIINQAKKTKKPLSLSRVISEDDSTTFGGNDNLIEDILANPEALDPSEKITNQVLTEDIADAIKSYLSKQEALVVLERYGFIDGAEKTLEEVASMLFKEGLTETTITRERVRQIQKKALAKLKHPVHRKVLQELR